MGKRSRAPGALGTGSVNIKRARELLPDEPDVASSSAAAPPAPSFLVQMLLYSWSWGFISLVFMQKVCAASVKDFEQCGATPPRDLLFFSRLGASGAYPGNMHKEAKRFLQESKLGLPVYVMMPMKVTTNAWKMFTQAIIMPHIVFSNIYHHYKDAWRKHIVQGTESIELFWQPMRNHPIMPIVQQREGGFMTSLIPLSMHGDDVPTVGVGKAWQKLITVFSWFLAVY